MATATIPVDLRNPGQVFACLGFMEAAEVLIGPCTGGFEWEGSETEATFTLSAAGDRQPIAAVLEFLAKAEVVVLCPAAIDGPWPSNAVATEVFPAPLVELKKSDGKGFTASALPIALTRDDDNVPISHWLGGDGRRPLKLFAGQQVGAQLARNLLFGDPKKAASRGFRHIFPALKEKAFADPFDETCASGGRFGFDARGSWGALGIGSSLDQQGVRTQIAPHVELLAAIGLENARPMSVATFAIRYAVWGVMLPTELCRVTISNPGAFLPGESFLHFLASLGEDEHYKKCFFADFEEEVQAKQIDAQEESVP